MELKGKVAIITGASRGIGKAIALRLAKEGVHIAAAAKTVEPHPELPGTIIETARECEALGPKALAVPMNVMHDDEVRAGVAAAIEAFGRLDIVIHNASALWWKPILDTPAKKYDLVNEVNARGAYLLAYHSLPHLIKAGGGHVVTLGPPVRTDHMDGKVAYLMSKFGMSMVALGVAQEHKKDNIAGNSLWPEILVETSATRNFGLGDRSLWYKPELVADAMYEVVRRDPMERTGQSLLVLEVLKEAGVTDFKPYQSDPEGNPPVVWFDAFPRAGGHERADDPGTKE